MKKNYFILFLIVFFLEIKNRIKNNKIHTKIPAINKNLNIKEDLQNLKHKQLNIEKKENNKLNIKKENSGELILAELINMYLFTIENFGLSLRFLRLNFEKEMQNFEKYKEFQKYLEIIQMLNPRNFQGLQGNFLLSIEQNFKIDDVLNKKTKIEFLDKNYKEDYSQYLKLFDETGINIANFNNLPIKKLNNFSYVEMSSENSKDIKIIKERKENFILGPLTDPIFFKDLYFAYFIKMILKNKGESSDFYKVLINFLSSEIKKNIFYINDPFEKIDNKVLITKLMKGPILAGAYNFVFLLIFMNKLTFERNIEDEKGMKIKKNCDFKDIVEFFKDLNLNKKSNLRKWSEYAFTGAAVAGAAYMTYPFISSMFPAMASVSVPALGKVALSANILNKIKNIGTGFLSSGSALDKLSNLTNILNMPIISPTKIGLKMLFGKNKILNNHKDLLENPLSGMFINFVISPFLNTVVSKLSGGNLDFILNYESFQKMITDPLLNKIITKKENFKLYIQKLKTKESYFSFSMINKLETLNRTDSRLLSKVTMFKDMAFSIGSNYIGRAEDNKNNILNNILNKNPEKFKNLSIEEIKNIDKASLKRAGEGFVKNSIMNIAQQFAPQLIGPAVEYMRNFKKKIN